MLLIFFDSVAAGLGVELQQASRQLQLEFRAAVAVVFTYCFFARGATGAALLAKHRTSFDQELEVRPHAQSARPCSERTQPSPSARL